MKEGTTLWEERARTGDIDQIQVKLGVHIALFVLSDHVPCRHFEPLLLFVYPNADSEQPYAFKASNKQWRKKVSRHTYPHTASSLFLSTPMC